MNTTLLLGVDFFLIIKTRLDFDNNQIQLRYGDKEMQTCIAYIQNVVIITVKKMTPERNIDLESIESIPLIEQWTEKNWKCLNKYEEESIDPQKMNELID